ncbi:MAG: DUF927 domain-containing protein, partial [Rhodospirillales bacterium]
MFNAVWGEHDQQGTRFIVGIKGGNVKHFPTDDAEQAEILAQQLDADGWDVYYAPAQFRGDRRLAADATHVPGLWADLDCGAGKQYENEQVAMARLLQWLEQHQLPRPTHVVHSGGGLHVYWLFDAAVALDQWRDAADRFKRALAAERVVDDPGCTSDAARILRVPGTSNRKNGDSRPVRLLHQTDTRVRLQDFLDHLPELGPRRGPKLDDEWSVQTALPPGNAPEIARKCAQIGHIRDQRGNVPEPLWRAGLSVLHRCEDAERYVHEWSAGDPRYDYAETQRKAEATAGPATCQHFSELAPDRCEGCPFRGKITSPVQISLAASAPEAANDEPWRLAKVGRFVVSSGGVWFSPADDEKPKKITQVPIWIVEVRERAKRHDQDPDYSSLLVEWCGVDGRTKRAFVPQEEVYSGDGLKKWAARENLASAVLDWRLFVTYISQYTIETIRGIGARPYHETLGWYQDGFVLGDRLVTADAVAPVVLQSRNTVAKLTADPRGSLEDWVAAVNTLDRRTYAAHKFAVQAAFGSPLLHLSHRHSAVVALVGPPGTGKTLSADIALSIYGAPSLLRQGARSSLVAMEKQLSAQRNVPYLVDEITQWTPSQVGAICYMAANGQGDAKLTRSRIETDVGEWCLTPFVTSNRPLTDYSQQQITQAHRARLVELYMGDEMGRLDGAALHGGCVAHNYGLAAVPYLQWVCKHRDQIPALVKDAQKQILDDFTIPDAHRFGVWTLAVSLVGGVIARSLGLIGWDPKLPVRQAAAELSRMSGKIQSAPDLARDMISEWLTENNDRIVFWAVGDKLGSTMVRDPIARSLGDGTIAIHRSYLHQLLADQGISRRACGEFLEPPSLVEEKRLNLAPGTAPVWVYVLRNGAVRFEP